MVEFTKEEQVRRNSIFNRNVDMVLNQRLKDTNGNRKEALRREKQLYKDNWTGNDDMDRGGISSRDLHQAVINKLSRKNISRSKSIKQNSFTPTKSKNQKSKSNISGSKQKSGLHVEIRQKQKYYVVRGDNGRILSLLKVKGSKLTKRQAEEKFKADHTLRKDQKINRVQLSHVTETTITAKKGVNISRPKRSKMIQYVIEGDYKGQHFTARSHIIGAKSSTGYVFAPSSASAKQEARANFGRMIAFKDSGDSDSDEKGLLLDKVTNYREGWVYYDPITRAH